MMLLSKARKTKRKETEITVVKYIEMRNPKKCDILCFIDFRNGAERGSPGDP